VANDVELIAIPPQTIAFLQQHGSVRRVEEPLGRLFAAIAEAGLTPAGPPMTRFDLGLEDPDGADFEVAVPLAVDADTKLPPKLGEGGIGELPAHYALVVVHEGPYEEIGAGYTALTEHLNAQGHAVAGPVSEVYLVSSEDGVPPAEYVTEVRVPVER
jgi:effector-binding domain-containing protein